MDKKKKMIIAGSIVLVMLMLMVIAPYISKILPFYIMGQPTLLFHVYNHDANNSHEVVVEIINPDNESVFKELYYLDPNDGAGSPKLPMMEDPKIMEKYTFKVVLDNDTMKLRNTMIDPWTTVDIDLYQNSHENPGEIVPLEISVIMI